MIGIEYERDRFGDKQKIVFLRNVEMHYTQRHFHRSFELLMLYSGECEVEIDGRSVSLTAGQMLLVFPYQVHCFREKTPSRGQLVIFSPDLISSFWGKYSSMRPSNIVTDFSDGVCNIVRNNLCANADLFMIKSCLYAICSELVIKCKFAVTGTGPSDTLSHRLIVYIADNFKENITLHSLAKHLNYSYQYLSQYLKKHLSMSFVEILNMYRIDYAIYLLQNKDLSINAVANQCGYETHRTFNRNFKQIMGMTPREAKKVKIKP